MPPKLCHPFDSPGKKLSAMLAKYLFRDLLQEGVLRLYDDILAAARRPKDFVPDPGFQYDKHNDRRISTSDINTDLSGCEKVGIDLAVWFQANEPRQTVVLVGIEPLRSHEFQGEATIAAPFTLHLNTHGASGNALRRFITDLTTNNYSVYITDFWKIYAIHHEKVYHGKDDIHLPIFQKELEILSEAGWNPIRIIAFGHSTHQAIQTQLRNFRTCPEYMRHPAAWGKKLDYYTQFVQLSAI